MEIKKENLQQLSDARLRSLIDHSFSIIALLTYAYPDSDEYEDLSLVKYLDRCILCATEIADERYT